MAYIMEIHSYILDCIEKKGAAFFLLIDPDDISSSEVKNLAEYSLKADVDAFLIGGSLMMDASFESFLETLKELTNIPTIIFPSSVEQVSKHADAILFLSLISGRNSELLIGKHVIAAPIIKSYGIEPIPTGYILVESGKVTTVEYMSNSKPIPSEKPKIAVATALAAQYLGMKFVYLEAGSGAQYSVPNEMIRAVSAHCDIPIIVGGGIRNTKTAKEKIESGAKIIVIGNHFEDKNNWQQIAEFSNVIHYKK